MDTDTKLETLEDIEESMRKFAKRYESGEITPLPLAFSDYANRIHAAAERERESWRQKVDDITEIADGFKNTLTKTLDWLSFQQNIQATGNSKRK